MENNSLNEDMEKWNPMKEDYNSPNFNCYDSGAGQHLTSIILLKERTIFSIYVGKLPPYMTENGLKNLFKRFGNVKRAFLHLTPYPNRVPDYGFIDYASFREAEMAIQHMHGAPPLNLRVQFAHRTEKQSFQANKDNVPLIQANNIADLEKEKEVLSSTVPEPISSEKQSSSSSQQPSSFVGRGKKILSTIDASKPNFSHLFNNLKAIACEEKEKCYHDKTLCMTGSLLSGIRVFLRNVSEPVEPNISLQTNGICLNCNKSAHLQCANCWGWYCSRQCQSQHWPQHYSLYCKKFLPTSILPKPLTLKLDSTTLENLAQERKQKKDISSTYVTQEYETSDISPIPQPTTMQDSKTLYCTEKSQVDTQEPSRDESALAAESPAERPTNSTVFLYDSCSTETLDVGKVHKLAIWEVLDPEIIFAFKFENINAITDLNKKIAECCSTCSSYKPLLGGICLARGPTADDAEENWYRAVILDTSKEEGTSRVFLVDYGNIYLVKNGNLLCIPSECMELPFQAVHIKLEGIKFEPSKIKEAVKSLKILLRDPFDALVTRQKADTYYVKMQDVADVLKEKGFLMND